MHHLLRDLVTVEFLRRPDQVVETARLIDEGGRMNDGIRLKKVRASWAHRAQDRFTLLRMGPPAPHGLDLIPGSRMDPAVRWTSTRGGLRPRPARFWTTTSSALSRLAPASRPPHGRRCPALRFEPWRRHHRHKLAVPTAMDRARRRGRGLLAPIGRQFRGCGTAVSCSSRVCALHPVPY